MKKTKPEREPKTPLRLNVDRNRCPWCGTEMKDGLYPHACHPPAEYVLEDPDDEIDVRF